MSRTDVHRPWPVQLADPHNRHLFYRYPLWPWQTGLAPIKNIGCGCRMCTGHYTRKQERRRDRAWSRRQLHTIRTTPAADRDTIDAPPRRPSW